MARFSFAIEFVLRNEGGFINHPDDPGGATNYGVSLRTLRRLEGQIVDEWDIDKDGDIDADDIRLMSRDQAVGFYQRHFWSPYFEQILDQAVATKIFDMAVNMGRRQAVRILQRARNLIVPDLTVDGLIGPKTVSAVNEVPPGTGPHLLHQLIQAEQARFYFNLVDHKPGRGVFLLGWLRRAYHWPD